MTMNNSICCPLLYDPPPRTIALGVEEVAIVLCMQNGKEEKFNFILSKVTQIDFPFSVPTFLLRLPFLFGAVQIGTASETLSEWADEEAGLEAVQKVVDSLDDIYALQDPLVEADVLRDILRDDRLHMLLQVSSSAGRRTMKWFIIKMELRPLL